MFTAIKRVRELLDSDYNHRMYLQRKQKLTDPALRARLADVVDALVKAGWPAPCSPMTDRGWLAATTTRCSSCPAPGSLRPKASSSTSPSTPASTDTEQGRGSTMERERANSRYGRDPRVTWIPDSAVLCRILPADVPDQLPRSDLGWDGKIYSDEWLEFEATPGAGTVSIFLATAVARKELTCGVYLSFDVALGTVLGEPR
jgi:hypothetical protein